MQIALPCPHCRRRPLRTARNVTYVRSAIWGNPHVGTAYLAGCGRCVWIRVVGKVARNVFEIPAGLVTRTIGLLNLVTIVPQNIVAVLWPGTEAHKRQCVSLYLFNEGMSLDDVELGEDGLTPMDRALAYRLAWVMHEAAGADGTITEEELSEGAAAVVAITDGRCHPDMAQVMVREPPDEFPPLPGFDYGKRIALVRAAMKTIAADHVVAESEREFVIVLGRQLALPDSFVTGLLEQPETNTASTDADALALACQTLELEPSAPLAMVKQRYAELAVRLAPVTAGWSAGSTAETFVPTEEDARRLEWSYAVLRKRAITAEMPATRKSRDKVASTPRHEAPTAERARTSTASAVAEPAVPDDEQTAQLRRLIAKRRFWRVALGRTMIATIAAWGIGFADSFFSIGYPDALYLVIGLVSFGGPLAIGIVCLELNSLFKTRPRNLLLLRPFAEPEVNDALMRVVRDRVGYLGFVYTLADSDVVAAETRQSILRAIPILNVLAPTPLSARTRIEFMQVGESLKKKWRRTYAWIVSGRRLFVIPASDNLWRDAVAELIDAADVVVVEISETAPGVVWEFQQLRHAPAGAGVVFLARPDRVENAQRSVEHFFQKRAGHLFIYDENGRLEDENGFVRAVAAGLVASTEAAQAAGAAQAAAAAEVKAAESAAVAITSEELSQ